MLGIVTGFVLATLAVSLYALTVPMGITSVSTAKRS